MAAERRHVTETITKVKRALEQLGDGSDSDDTIVGTSNRGRKLKRKAKYVHEGKLDDGRGVNGYKEEIEYFGTRKKIIYRKHGRSKRLAIDSEEEESQDSEAEESGSELFDPYDGLDLAKLLAPLDSAADLPKHPSLAYIYTSRTLNELIQQSLEKICEEKSHTVKLKNLMTKFLGDDPWINLEKLKWPEEDHAAIARERSEGILRGFIDLNGSARASGGGSVGGGAETNGKLTNGTPKVVENGVDESRDVNMTDEANGHPEPPASDARNVENEETAQSATQDTVIVTVDDDDLKTTKGPDPTSPKEDTLALPEPRRMTTRSTHHNGASPAPPSDSPSSEIDPFFYPPDYKVDRDNGLPPGEAEETRRLLAAAVQRQDEFMRGLKRVQDGLLRAESMRKKVWDWCRTMEGMRDYHERIAQFSRDPNAANFDIDEGENVGLSDGEDWYDPDVWKLDGPLQKGQEEEEEGEVIPHGKKTRRRGDR